MADTKIIRERKYIDVDTTYENVLEWAEEGHTLVFLSKPELFLELSPAQVKDLPAKVKTSYSLAKADFKTQNKAFTDPILELATASFDYGSATDQLTVMQDPNSKFKIKWFRQDQLKDKYREGWSVVTDELESQRGLRDTGYHMIGKKELILMQMDKKKYAALEKMKQDRHTQLFEKNAEDMKRVAHSMNAVGTFDTSEEDINIPLS